MFVFLGGRAPGVNIGEAAPNHSPYFDIDESALKTGIRVLAGLAIRFLHGEVEKQKSQDLLALLSLSVYKAAFPSNIQMAI